MYMYMYVYTLILISIDKGILMTFGGGENGCLGHGNHSEVKQVCHVILTQ